jgi:hypothetical protein
MTDRDSAIRNYLNYLANPSSAINQSAIDAAEAAVASASDVLERVKALSRLDAAKHVDGSALRDGFIANAAAWATDNQVSPSAFRQLGVSESDLVSAGVVVKGVRGRKAGKTLGGPKRSRTSIPDVRAMIPHGRFTISELIRASGASVATVRKAIDLHIADGKVVSHGPDANHANRGRAPIIFEGL